MTIKVASVGIPEGITPTRKHSGDAGIDLYYNGDPINVRPHGTTILTTGISVQIPEGYVGIVEDKSRNDFLILGRVVDSTYQGEILVKVVNLMNRPMGFNTGQAIAQLVIYPCLIEPVEKVSYEELWHTESDRGSTGGIVTQFNGVIDL